MAWWAIGIDLPWPLMDKIIHLGETSSFFRVMGQWYRGDTLENDRIHSYKPKRELTVDG